MKSTAVEQPPQSSTLVQALKREFVARQQLQRDCYVHFLYRVYGHQMCCVDRDRYCLKKIVKRQIFYYLFLSVLKTTN